MNQRNARNGIEAKQQPPLAFGRQKERNVEKKWNKTKSIHFHGRWARVSANALALCAYWLLCAHPRRRTQMDEQVNWTMCVSFAFCICLFPFRVINCISLQKRTGDRTPAVICRFRQIHWAVICYVRARMHTHRDHRVNDGEYHSGNSHFTRTFIIYLFISSSSLSHRSDHFQNEQKICGFYFNFVCICNWHVALLFHSHLARRHRACTILGHFFPRGIVVFFSIWRFAF